MFTEPEEIFTSCCENKDEKPHIVTIEWVKKCVCKYTGLTLQQLEMKSRQLEIRESRQIAMYFCRLYKTGSLAKIGWDFGKKDHATVMHACRVISNHIEKEPSFSRKIEEINNLITFRPFVKMEVKQPKRLRAKDIRRRPKVKLKVLIKNNAKEIDENYILAAKQNLRANVF